MPVKLFSRYQTFTFSESSEYDQFPHQFKIGGVRKQTTWSFGLRNMVGNDSNVVGNESSIEGKDKSLVGNYSNKEGYDAGSK